MFSSNIIVHVIALLNIAACYDVTSTHSRPKSIPLNFKDAIAHLHAQKQLVDHHEQLKAVSEHFSHQFGHISKMFASFRSSTATDSQMGQLMPLLQSETNVSVECIRQIKQVWTGLESGSYFAEKSKYKQSVVAHIIKLLIFCVSSYILMCIYFKCWIRLANRRVVF